MQTWTEARVPAMDMLRAYLLILLLTTDAAILVFGFFYILTIFSVSYGTTTLGLPNTTVLYFAGLWAFPLSSSSIQKPSFHRAGPLGRHVLLRHDVRFDGGLGDCLFLRAVLHARVRDKRPLSAIA